MPAVSVAYAEEQTGSIVISKTVTGNAASEDNEFLFTIKAWQGEQTIYKKIADLTGNMETAEFQGTVSVQGYITDYDEDYYIEPGDTGAYLDVDVGPIDNTGLLYLSRILNVNETLAVPDPYIYDMTIDGKIYPVHIWLDSLKILQDDDDKPFPVYTFGFYIEDNEENAGINMFKASSTGRTSRTMGDVVYVDFSKQGLQPAADPNTYTFSLKSGENREVQIPDGYTYEITEGETDGWELVSVETSGGAAANGAVVNGTMDENTPATVSFTNVKKVDTTDDPKGEDPEDPKDDEPKDSEPTEPTDPKPPVTPEPEDPAPQDPTPQDPTPGSDDPEPAKTPLLSIANTTDAKNVQVGDVIPYIITVTNTGEGDAAGVEVVDVLPEGLTYVSDDSNGRVDGQNVTWTVDVAAGESVSIVINARVNEKASGKVVNSAFITPDANVPTVPQKDVDEESVEIARPDTSLSTGDGEDEGKTDGKDDGAKTPESKDDAKANPPAKQNTPTSQSKPAAAPAATTPKTADVANTTLWLTLLALSGAGLAGAYRLRRKEER